MPLNAPIQPTDVAVLDNGGQPHVVPPDAAKQLIANGWTQAPPEVLQHLKAVEAQNTPLGALKTGVESAFSTATFGLSTPLETGLGIRTPEEIQAGQEANPGSNFAGSALGIVAPLGAEKLLGSSVAGLAPGLISKAGGAVTEGVAHAIAPTTALGRISTSVLANGAGSAIEGAFYGLGQSVSDDALDPKLTVESAFSRGAADALLGAGTGALLGAPAGLISGTARETLPKLAPWLKAVEDDGYKKAWGLNDAEIKKLGVPDASSLIKDIRDNELAGPFTSPTKMRENATNLIDDNRTIIADASTKPADRLVAQKLIDLGQNTIKVADLAQAVREASSNGPGVLGRVLENPVASAFAAVGAFHHPLGAAGYLAKDALIRGVGEGNLQAGAAGLGRSLVEPFLEGPKPLPAGLKAEAQPPLPTNLPKGIAKAAQTPTTQVSQGSISDVENITGRMHAATDAFEKLKNPSLREVGDYHATIDELKELHEEAVANLGKQPNPNVPLIKPNTPEQIAALAAMERTQRTVLSGLKDAVGDIITGKKSSLKAARSDDDLGLVIKNVNFLGSPERLQDTAKSLTNEVAEHTPGVVYETASTVGRMQSFLAANTPQAIKPYPLGPTIQPDRSSLLKFDLLVQAVTHPIETLKANPSAAVVGAIEAVYPALMNEVRSMMLQQLSLHPDVSKLTYAQRTAISNIQGVDLDGSHQQQNIQMAQMAYMSQPKPAPQGKPRGETKQSVKLSTPAERLTPFGQPSLRQP